MCVCVCVFFFFNFRPLFLASAAERSARANIWNVTRPGRRAFGPTPFTSKCATRARPSPSSCFCSSPNAASSVYDYCVVCCLGAFAKLWEVTISLVMPGRPDVRMEQLRTCSTDCRKTLWCGPLVKYVEKRKALG